MDVADLVHALVGGDGEVDGLVLVDALGFAVVRGGGAGGDDGEEIAGFNGGIPGDLDDRAADGGAGAGDGDLGQGGLGIGGGVGDGGADARHGGLELLGVGGLDIGAACLLGDAGEGGVVLVGAEAEADHVGGEADAALFERAGQFARVAFAAFEPVGDENHGGGAVCIGKLCRRAFDGVGEGGLAGGGDAIDPFEDAVAGGGAGLDEGFDIAAIAAAAVAIGHQADLALFGPLAEEGVHHVAGDLDLGGAVDLAPHGVGAVEHDHHVFLGRGGGGGDCEARGQNGFAVK